ncbi:hypothetical protein GCM10027344_31290 [Spelaeicoccus albus]
MTATVGLSMRLLRGGGRRDYQSVVLAVVAYAVTTALLIVILGGLFAFHDRAERASAWSVTGVSSAAEHGRQGPIIAAHHEPAGGKSMTVVEIAGAPKNAPGESAPPGMTRAPKPGEVFVSPALATLMRTLPDAQLADRFPAVAGVLPTDSMPTPGSLVAVVGRDDGALSGNSATGSWDGLEPHHYTSFAEPQASLAIDADASSLGVDDDASLYYGLAWLAVLLMAVPLVTLGGAAARLGVSRRNARLAALRLAGATPRQVVGMTAVESMVHAGTGAVIGAVLSIVLLPIAGVVPFQGSGFGFAGLWIGVVPLLAVLAGVVILAGVSSVLGLRRVVVSPLGVAARTTPPGVSWIRALVFFAVIIGWNVLARSPAGFGISMVLIALFCVFSVIGVIGPWLVAMMAKIRARSATGPVNLLAARRLLDDPKGAWRGVSGLALAGFVAAIVSVMPALTSAVSAPPSSVSVTASSSAAAGQLAATARDRLDDAQVAAAVTTAKDRVVIRPKADTPAAEDEVTTIAAKSADGAPVTSTATRAASDAELMSDIRTGVLFTLLITFVIAASSVGITSAASTLDRRQLYGLMRLAGTERRVLDAVRFKTTLWPLLLTVAVSAGLGLFFTLPMLGSLVAQPAGLFMLAGCLLVGIAMVLAASAASRPILRDVLRDPSPRPD